MCSLLRHNKCGIKLYASVENLWLALSSCVASCKIKLFVFFFSRILTALRCVCDDRCYVPTVPDGHAFSGCLWAGRGSALGGGSAVNGTLFLFALNLTLHLRIL
jgi:hypothetical protein